ncbi:kelch repeat and BTB domain-containing protein 11 [Anguilla rostrata]|uniref:kelch repeat and BTB domain-containing protein 11 n=1 Tax=Anguilla rostrata TaxID=7938 RepID=UPI0030CD951A
MRTLRQCLWLLLLWFAAWLQYGAEWARRVFGSRTLRLDPAGQRADHSESRKPEPWRTDPAWRTYCGREGPTVTVQTSTHAFQVDLGRLSEASEYFRALSRSRMRETAESLVHLEHVPSHVFHNLLEFTFLGRFSVPEEELGLHIQMGSYLLVQPFVSECLSSLASVLTPENCEAYLAFAREICCLEMLEAVRRYLSTNLLELAHLTGRLDPEEREELIRLRLGGARRLCALRKENLTSGSQSDTAAARHLYSLAGEEEEEGGAWRAEAELPFAADKWCFTTAVLHNYLYLIGGYRHRVRRGYEFKMASFRYNPFTHSWVSTAPLIKHRRHFSAAACEGSVFALGGWYLDSLVAPDSGTALYTAVERYDPWADSWAFVSSLPLTDFRFAVSLSHDVPLATALRRRVYVLGTVQRTGEKLVLQYDVTQDSWSELLPTLTRSDADIPSLYFLGATDRLFVIGGTNSANVVTSLCVESGRWGRVRATEKMWLAGQGTVLNDQVYMSDVEHNSIVRLDLRSLAVHRLPPFPIHTSYEALFHLHF